MAEFEKLFEDFDVDVKKVCRAYLNSDDAYTIELALRQKAQKLETAFIAWVNENAVCIRNKDRHECEDTPEYCEFALPLSKIVKEKKS